MKLAILIQRDQAKLAALRFQSGIQTVREILDKMVAGVPPNPSIKEGGTSSPRFIMAETPCPEAPPWGSMDSGDARTLGKHELWGSMKSGST